MWVMSIEVYYSFCGGKMVIFSDNLLIIKCASRFLVVPQPLNLSNYDLKRISIDGEDQFWTENTETLQSYFYVDDLRNFPSGNALGVRWKTESNTFEFKKNLKQKPLTRRKKLSLLSSAYEHLGLAVPFLFHGILFIQQLSRGNLGWMKLYRRTFR